MVKPSKLQQNLQVPSMSEHFETLYVDSGRIACDGGSGPTGHPRIFLDLIKRGESTCPYCSRHYVLKGELKHAH